MSARATIFRSMINISDIFLAYLSNYVFVQFFPIVMHSCELNFRYHQAYDSRPIVCLV